MLLPLGGVVAMRSVLIKRQWPFMVLLAIAMMIFAFGLATTYVAMLLWIQAFSTGTVIPGIKLFIPFGVIVNLVGIAYLLFLGIRR